MWHDFYVHILPCIIVTLLFISPILIEDFILFLRKKKVTPKENTKENNIFAEWDKQYSYWVTCQYCGKDTSSVTIHNCVARQKAVRLINSFQEVEASVAQEMAIYYCHDTEKMYIGDKEISLEIDFALNAALQHRNSEYFKNLESLLKEEE